MKRCTQSVGHAQVTPRVLTSTLGHGRNSSLFIDITVDDKQIWQDLQ